MKVKITSFLLTVVVILLSFSMFSCAKNREYDADVVVKEAEKLIKASETLNFIYYGSGIPYVTDESYANGYYYMADSLAASEMGINTLDDLKKKTKEVFGADMYNMMVNTKLGNVTDSDGNIVNYARYYQKYDDTTGEPEYIMVYKNAEILLKDTVSYDYESLCAVESKRETVYVEIDAQVTTPEGKKQQRTLRIGLIEEENGWRLATSTYASYYDSDRYNELQKKDKN